MTGFFISPSLVSQCAALLAGAVHCAHMAPKLLKTRGGWPAGRVAWRRGCGRPAVALAVCAVGFASGCGKPLLSPNEPRSQYSRYDLVRGQFAPQYVEDEFGRRLPNLRGRLLRQD